MHIVAIAMVKNEMDVIESFVRHTLSFADELLICDHQSTDATREILERLKAEGLPLDIRTEYRAAHVQADVMSTLLREAAEEHGADLIVPLDADEFLLPKAPGDVREVLEGLSPERNYIVYWRFYAPAGGTEAEFLLARPLRRAAGYDVCSKCIVGGAAARTSHLRLVEGSHYAYAADDPTQLMVSMEPCGLFLAHFYYRSAEQFRAKAVVAWMNIAAQYSRDALTGGGYRAFAARAVMGDPMTDKDPTRGGESCDLHGYAAMQTLRYSGAAKPDAFQNLVAAGEALAESYAELRAAEQQPGATSVVPYLGEEAPFRASLASVRAEAFPRHKILVPVLAGTFPEDAAAEDAVILPLTDHVDATFDALARHADGDFVEWVLPGETVLPQKLRAMVTSFLLQDEPFAFYVSDAPQQSHAPGSPYLEIGVRMEENVMRMTREGFYHMLLTFGAVPTGGMSALLLRREQMDACGWLRDGFAGGRFDLFRIYRTLLLGPGAAGRPNVGTLHSCDHGGSPEASLVDCVRHQMTWQHCLQKDGSSLPPEQRAQAVDRFRKSGIALLTQALEAGEDMAAPLWQAYQAMLRDA